MNQCLLVILLPIFTHSAEVDNFKVIATTKKSLSQNEPKISKNNLLNQTLSLASIESTKTVNSIINIYIKRLSTTVKDCTDREEVMTAIRYIFDTNFPDIVDDIDSNLYESNKVLMDLFRKEQMDSVYKGFEVPLNNGCCSPVLKIDGYNVGKDKTDHFLSHGFMYYRRYSEKTEQAFHKSTNMTATLRTDSQEKRVDDALELGIFQEESTWGLHNSGVKSYGDLAANYNGLLFYKNLLETEKYLKCENTKFEIKGKFSISEYVDDSWDESINCSSYNSKENRDIVRKNMKEYGFEKCPIDFKRCETLIKKYGSVAPKILHPLCLESNSQHTQVEKGQNKLVSFFGFLKQINPTNIIRVLNGAR